MKSRKKKVALIQIILLFLALILIYFTYFNNESKKFVGDEEKNKISEKNKNKVTSQIEKNKFSDVEYQGIDLNGNRYLIKSEEAEFDVSKPELIFMEIMNTTFYFKDGTKLSVSADRGVYNNLTNDMEFRENVLAIYGENKINADNLDYFNTKSLLTVYGNVIGNGLKGDIVADKLNFDISKRTLDISMFNNDQINVNVKN